MTQSIFILWETQELILDYRRYIGNGLKTHRCRYCSKVSNEMLASANHYAKNEAVCPEKINIRVEIQND